MAFLVKALFLWNKYSKNADISVLSYFLAIFFEFFSPYREMLPSTICMPNFRSIGPFTQKLQGGGRICPLPTIPYCKKPGLFRVNCFLQDNASAGIQFLQTSIEIKLYQNLWNRLYRHLFWYSLPPSAWYTWLCNNISVNQCKVFWNPLVFYLYDDSLILCYSSCFCLLLSLWL